MHQCGVGIGLFEISPFGNQEIKQEIFWAAEIPRQINDVYGLLIGWFLGYYLNFFIII